MKITSRILEQFLKKKIVSQNNFPGIVVGFVEKLEKHPQADRLRIATVDIGTQKTTIVCGGWNLTEGQYVPVALPGARLGDFTEITTTKIRGVESNGMICGKDELDLGPSAPYEIMTLPETKPGTALSTLFADTLRAPDVVKLLTDHTVAVEGWEMPWRSLQNIVTGKLLSVEKINGTDKLHKGIFDIGTLPPHQIQIVFGSVYPLAIGDIIPLALLGAKLANGEIKKTVLHGIESNGMACGDSEIGIQNSATGITKFPKNTLLGRPIAEILDYTDIVFEIENVAITHRPDLWGHEGFARELAATTGKLWKMPSTKKIIEEKSPLKITIAQKNICRRFSGCIVEGITIKESPQWLKSRLQAVGIRPVNNIVDITNYVMIEIGQPMHAFDRAVVRTDHLLIRQATEGEQMMTLDHKKRTFTTNDVLIEDGTSRALTLAGIMGGKESEISNNTTTIILEAASWDPVLIRKTCQRQELRSDAAQRFEKNLDPTLTIRAIMRAVELIKKICKNATTVGGMVDVVQETIPQHTITVNWERALTKIGTAVSREKAIKNLKNLGFTVKKGRGVLIVNPPHWRATHTHTEDDIVEEIVRMEGYDAIPAILPTLPIKLPHENHERKLKHHTRDLLSLGAGWTEISSYSFYDKKAITQCTLDPAKHFAMKNIISEEATHLRASMLPSLLKAAAQNLRFTEAVNLYELGRTYEKSADFMPKEHKVLAGIYVNQKDAPENAFLHVKGVLEMLLTKFPVAYAAINRSENAVPYAHPAACTEINVNGKIIGRLMLVHPEVTAHYELPEQTVYFEMYFTPLAKACAVENKARPLNRFPEIIFDVSILTNRTTESEKIVQTLKKSAPELITKIELFDVFSHPSLGPDKKALAYHITLYDDERTLTDTDLRSVQEKIPECIAAYGTLRV